MSLSIPAEKSFSENDRTTSTALIGHERADDWKNEDENGKDHFSCDLVLQSKLHILFLQTIHSLGISLHRPSQESLRRYSQLWLPLVAHYHQKVQSSSFGEEAEQAVVGLIPPSDVAWLWHCHRLAPYRYTQHIRERFGLQVRDGDEETLEAYPPFTLQHHVPGEDKEEEQSLLPAAVNARKLWRELYPAEPFFLTTSAQTSVRGGEQEQAENKDTNEAGNGLLLSGFDVLASTERQSTFLWQVSGPRFRDEKFLQDGVANYYRFLKLRGTEEGRRQIIVPTYQIDLMWHTHILSSITKYNRDCRSIVGSTLHHDDSINDRSVGSVLDAAYHATKELWFARYETEYAVPGGMYRGEPPEPYYSTDWCGGAMAAAAVDSVVATPTGPYVHLIGRVGASSTPGLDGATWISPDGITPDGKPAFIAAASRSITKGVNNNPYRQEYIFGNGSKGGGYYHIMTKDAYSILFVRIRRRIEAKKSEISCVGCLACTFPCTNAGERKQKLEEELADLEDMATIVLARSQASVPKGIVGLPEEVTKNPTKVSDSNIYYSNNGDWLLPVVLLDAGGGCGASSDRGFWGAGCAGGGCGAAACGGAGCGGAGCGGGGCGGGCGGG